jgi:hypothetical protein
MWYNEYNERTKGVVEMRRKLKELREILKEVGKLLEVVLDLLTKVALIAVSVVGILQYLSGSG